MGLVDDYILQNNINVTTVIIVGAVAAIVASAAYSAGSLMTKNKLKMGLSPALVQGQYAAGPFNSSLKTGFADKNLQVRGKDSIEILRNASRDLARKQYSNS